VGATGSAIRTLVLFLSSLIMQESQGLSYGIYFHGS
jgi:hypothetical protein